MENKIFSGREARYNSLIIKILYEKGALSAFNIAKNIVWNDSIGKVTDMHHKYSKVNSVLVRKNGRLPELDKQEFIKKTEKGYLLTFKGWCSALCLSKEIREPGFDYLFEFVAIFPELKKIMEILMKSYPEENLETYKIFHKITIELLKKGLNFNLIPNKEFIDFFNREYQEMSVKLLKSEKKGEELWRNNPELRAAFLEFAERINKVAIKELESFQTIIKKLKNDAGEDQP